MNKHEDFSDDLLREFMNPERIEKAPDKLVTKTMSRILSETAKIKPAPRNIEDKRVLAYSAVITLALFISAFIIPEGEIYSLKPIISKIIGDLNISIPRIDITPIFNQELPGIIIYVIFALLVLTILDRGLSFYFHRENRTDR